MKESQAIEAMGALAHEIRLKIVRHLISCGQSGDAAGLIGKAVGAAPSKVTFHMATLEKAGLVTSVRESRHIIYSISFAKMGALINYLLADCCKNDPGILSCCRGEKKS